MTPSLGLDHALVAVRDIAAVRETYLALGFLSRGFSQHPWGTSTTVLIFPGQLYEIVGIGDPALLDGYETGGFRFGRHVEAYLAEREGVALTALNSSDAAADAEALAARGVEITGTIDFGRDVTRSDGTPDRTRTQLKVMANARFPRLSLFACQQFRRDLIEYPEWMAHPNGVTGIAGLTIVADPADLPTIAEGLSRVHGVPARPQGEGFTIPTAKGAWTVTSRTGFAARFGAAPDWVTEPSIAGIDLTTDTPDRVAEAAQALALPFEWRDGHVLLTDPGPLGGVCLRFGPQNG